MTEGGLEPLFSELLTSIAPHKKYQVEAVYYDTKSVRHTIQVKRNLIRIKIARSFHDAPDRILRILGLILFSKLFRFKIDNSHRREYRKFVEEEILPRYPVKTRKPSARYKPEGKYYNLSEIFDELNDAYFDGKLKKPVLGWSLKKSYTRLGFYSDDKNLLVISRIFDASNVPSNVVMYMVYHEMLHIAIPARFKNGRRSIHPRELRIKDRAFPEFKEIQKWIRVNRKRL